MKPTYFIKNSKKVLGMVFIIDNHKVILMYKSEIDISFGMQIIDKMGNNIKDPETEEILKKFLFWK